MFLNSAYNFRGLSSVFLKNMHYFRDKLLGLLILSVSLLVTANENLKKDDIQGRIYGGDEAQPGKWPFFCSLAIKNFHFTNEINICGCVILGKKWVVSVTTCTKDYSAEKIYVYAGYPRATITNYKQNLRAKAKYEHPDYTPNTNDIVLVELKTEFLYSHLVLPIQLPLDDKDIVPVGTECAIMGFGETEFEQGERRKLQQGFLKVVTKTDCLFTYGSIIRDSHICGNHPTEITGLCRGDTGSPLACFDEKKQEYILRGVASFGTSVCGINSAPEVWTRISYYVKWIRDTVIECDLPTLPANAFTNSTNHHGGKFKVGEKMLLFCEKGYQHRKGATQSTCRMSGLFDKIDIDCIPKSTYSEWKIGTCSVTCGEGTRMDTRDCLDGICIENLHRVAPCRLHACPDGKDVCVSLKCSSDATCEKFFDSENFHCHCLPEFVGNGKECKRKPDEKEFGSENTNG